MILLIVPILRINGTRVSMLCCEQCEWLLIKTDICLIWYLGALFTSIFFLRKDEKIQRVLVILTLLTEM